MKEHDFFKREDTRFECRLCHWDWARKSDTLCPGVTRYAWGSHPPSLKDRFALSKQNLKPKKVKEPIACCYSMKYNEWTWLYDEKDCEIIDPELPPIVQWDDVGELKTIGQLKKINLVLSEDIKPRAVAWVWDKEKEKGLWIPLYHEDDCRWEAKDSWITKTQLKQNYLLSEGWIKRIGESDRLLDHSKYNTKIKLYSRKRIENFLADNAEEYAEWLDKRDRYIAIFEANRDKIFAKRNAIKEQTKMCLQCASGCSLPDGFFCAIHPMGLDYMPCQDFSGRDRS